MWIKICGNTNLTDAMHAVSSGASALGFVFAPSPRRVTVEQARAITARLPLNVDRYGVFVHAPFDEIVSTVTGAGLSGAQLHINDDPELPARLRAHFLHQPRPFRITGVVHSGDDLEQKLTLLERDPSIDAVLVDARSQHAPGGTGQRFDWQAALPAFLSRAGRTRLILAGGLNPENVAEAATLLQPWGVDVVTGVEASPGRKDPACVEAFLRNTQRACAQFEHGKQPDATKA